MRGSALKREEHLGPAVAWTYCAVIIFLALALNAGLKQAAIHSHEIADLLRTRTAAGALMILRALYSVVLVVILSRKHSLRSFVRTIGLDQPPTFASWVVAWIVIGVGFLDLWWAGMDTIPSDQRASWFFTGGIQTWWFFLVHSLVIGPVYQQSALLGFAYPLFRRSYGPLVSGLLVVGVRVFFSWTTITGSWHALVCLSALWMVILVMRERTGTVWGCIVCQAFYNAVVLRQGLICLGGMLLLLLYVFPKRRATKTGGEAHNADRLAKFPQPATERHRRSTHRQKRTADSKSPAL